MKVGQTPQGIRPPSELPAQAKPVAPASTAPAPAPAIIVPPPSSSGPGRKLLYGVLATIILAGIIYSIASLMGGSDTTPSTSASPSPQESATISPQIGLLTAYFKPVGDPLELKTDGTALADLKNAVLTSQPARQQALRIPITGTAAKDLGSMLSLLAEAGQIPADITTTLGTDWAVLVYGQREQFDRDGNPITNSPGNRLVLIGELKDPIAARAALTKWESSAVAPLAGQFASLFEVDVTKALVSQFATGTYRTTSIRYWNFPYADRSIDWAIATASNNSSYLVMSGSRESMFFAIDQLMQ